MSHNVGLQRNESILPVPRKELEQKYEPLMKPFHGHFWRGVDVPEAEWKASESNIKFARSWCERITYFIDGFICEICA